MGHGLPHGLSAPVRPALGTLVGVFEWQALCINQFSGRITKARPVDRAQGPQAESPARWDLPGTLDARIWAWGTPILGKTPDFGLGDLDGKTAF